MFFDMLNDIIQKNQKTYSVLKKLHSINGNMYHHYRENLIDDFSNSFEK
jgi:hypothetical protein